MRNTHECTAKKRIMNYICSNRTKGRKAAFQPGQAGLKVNEAYGGRTVPKKAGGVFRNNAMVRGPIIYYVSQCVLKIAIVCLN